MLFAPKFSLFEYNIAKDFLFDSVGFELYNACNNLVDHSDSLSPILTIVPVLEHMINLMPGKLDVIGEVKDLTQFFLAIWYIVAACVCLATDFRRRDSSTLGITFFVLLFFSAHIDIYLLDEFFIQEHGIPHEVNNVDIWKDFLLEKLQPVKDDPTADSLHLWLGITQVMIDRLSSYYYSM